MWKPKNKKYGEKVLLGYTKKDLYGERRPVYLRGFSWDCNWYWSGGYIGNKDFHAHFNGAFLDTPDIRGHVLGSFITPWSENPGHPYVVVRNGCSIWEGIETFLDDVPEHISRNWWRIKDLYKQFYILQEAAEVFHVGGRCSSSERNPRELNATQANRINRHIENVIIPEILKALSPATV